MKDDKVFFGCSCNPMYLDRNAGTVIWPNSYIKNKVTELQIYDESVTQAIVPSAWNTGEKFCQAMDYVEQVYQIMSPDLAKQLDGLHHTCFGKRGWDIILRRWLHAYIGSMYEKYTVAEYVYASYSKPYIIEHDIVKVPRANDEIYDEALLCQQYQDAFLWCGNKRETKKSINADKMQIVESLERQVWQIGKDQKFDAIEKAVCHRKTTLALHFPCLDLNTKMLELLTGGRIKRIAVDFKLPQKKTIDIHLRNRIVNRTDKQDEFVNFVYGSIWKYIPMEIMEDFPDIYMKYQKMKYETPKIIVDSIGVYMNHVFKIFVADKLRAGSKLYIIQHGGNAGIERYVGNWEYSIADKYYSWGAKSNRKLYPMPPGKLLQLRPTKNKDNKKVLYAVYSWYSLLQRLLLAKEANLDGFYEYEGRFFASLNQNILKRLRVRPYVGCAKQDKDRLGQVNPNIRYDMTKSYTDSLKEARLVVTTVARTTFMEALWIDKPVILLYNDDFFAADESAREIIHKLKKCKVFVEDPQEAAQLISSIYDHVDEWWNEPQRQQVIKEFRQMYLMQCGFPKLKWMVELLKESIMR